MNRENENNKSVRDRMLVHSTAEHRHHRATCHVMEMWEWCDLLFVCVQIQQTTQLPIDNMVWWETSVHPPVLWSGQGCTCLLAVEFILTSLHTTCCHRTDVENQLGLRMTPGTNHLASKLENKGFPKRRQSSLRYHH